jgi:hypothetical protein
MIAEILEYRVVAEDGVVNVKLGYYEDLTPQTQLETDYIVIPFAQFTRPLVIDRMNDAIRRKVKERDSLDNPPTVDQIETILPPGFRTVIPG